MRQATLTPMRIHADGQANAWRNCQTECHLGFRRPPLVPLSDSADLFCTMLAYVRSRDAKSVGIGSRNNLSESRNRWRSAEACPRSSAKTPR